MNYGSSLIIYRCLITPELSDIKQPVVMLMESVGQELWIWGMVFLAPRCLGPQLDDWKAGATQQLAAAIL